MKKIITTLVLALFTLTLSAQSYTQNGTVFKSTTTKKAKVEPTLTSFTWEDSKGSYPIYISENGRCFYYKTSSTGHKYKCYLSEEVSKDICKQTKREYKQRKKLYYGQNV